MDEIVTLDAGGDANRSYVVLSRERRRAWCVDPSYAAGRILEVCRRAGCDLTDVLLTHTHGDHTATLPELRAAADVRVRVHRAERAIPEGSDPVSGDGPLHGLPEVTALHTPGHTPGGLCYVFDGAIFTGDILFVDWVGRADLPGGDPRALFRSLARLRTLPAGLLIHPGHHYGSVERRTLGEEAVLNKFLACAAYARFLEILPELTS
jgi:glyoxylase-like metal-dependent hydrolase (beta-lactamase superfamily II)